MPVHPKIDDFSKKPFGEWQERWYDIAFGKGNYQVNHLGEVRNKKKKTGKLLKLDTQYRVNLSDGQGNMSKKRVYHLALESIFSHIPRNGRTGDHIDENHHNNHISNLQWLTPSQQIIKSNQLKPRNHGPAQSKPVEQWTLGTPSTKVATFSSIMEAGRKTGILPGGISNCARGKKSSAGGFQWRFQELESQKDLEGEKWGTNDKLVAALEERDDKKKLENTEKVRISNLGRLKDALGRISKGTKHNDTCYRKYGGWQMHQLVWMVWGDGQPVPREGDKLVICHNDAIPRDEDGCASNAIEHLRIDTKRENTKEYYREKAKKRTFSASLTTPPIINQELENVARGTLE